MLAKAADLDVKAAASSKEYSRIRAGLRAEREAVDDAVEEVTTGVGEFPPESRRGVWKGPTSMSTCTYFCCLDLF